jgi:hypothetical protein
MKPMNFRQLLALAATDELGLWEKLNNPKSKLVEFEQFRFQAGENAFVLSPKKWIETTQAIGLLINFGAATFREGCKRIVNQSFVSSCLRVNQEKQELHG